MKFLLNKKVEKPADSMQIPNTIKKSKWKKFIKWIVIILIIVIIIKIAADRVVAKITKITSSEAVTETALVEKRDIQVVLSSSGTVEPLNTYAVSTLIQGEVITANFEEGDQVEEGDVLYQVSTDDIDSKIDTAKTSVSRAETSHTKAVKAYDKAVVKYNEALSDYNEAASEYGNLNIETTATGIVKTLYVKEGDTVQSGSQIADIYDNSSMLLEIPFNASEVNSTLVGKTAEVEIADSFETIKGKVTKVSSIEEVLSGNRVVKTVTIQVKNPGGLTTNNTATASIGEIYSSSEGIFRVLEETVITADKVGDIAALKIEEGSEITLGDIVIVLDSNSVEDKLDSYKNSLENAEDSMDNAKDSVENAEESIDDAKTDLQDVIDSTSDYSITAPISGVVIRKNTLAGDTISSNSGTLCIIYDLSALTFEMSVDELDVMSVAVGQEVNITADALEGVKITGEIINVSLESTQSSGVTQYPVTVKIAEAGDLLPGMNVTGEIIIEKVEGVLAIPSDALRRGDVVYVADDSVIEAVGDVPAGFKEVAVETGLTDGDYVEIISGLKGDEKVYVTRTAVAITTQMMPGGEMGTRPSGGGGNMGNRPSGNGGGFTP